MANLNDPGACRQQIKISPGSTKWIWFDWPKRELGTSTITSATWTLPSWATNEDQEIDGLRVGLLLTAEATASGQTGWVELAIVTSAGETLQARRGALVTPEGH